MKEGILGELYFDRFSFQDNRGLLTKVYDPNTYRVTGVNFAPKEVFFSESIEGAIRGIHCPIADREFWRLIAITRGRVDDILIDLRTQSTTRGQIVRQVLDASSPFILLPMGVGHGFQSLTEGSQMLYLFGHMYSDTKEVGVNPMSKCFEWRNPISTISTKDKGLPYYEH
jgi:dTDP-4-dehydrorhamnose 3,5-epimerase-like enzyme